MKEIEFRLTLDDVYAFHKHHLKFGWVFGLLFVLVASSAVAIVWYAKSEQHAGRDPWVVLIVLGPLWLLCPIWLVIRKYVFTRRYRGKDSEKLMCLQKVAIGPEGMKISNEYGVSTIRWHAFEKIDLAKDHLFIYETTASAMVIPRRAFALDEDFRAFADLVMHYLQEATVQECK